MEILKPGRILVDYGPVTMVIEASRKGKPDTEAALSGAEIVPVMLEQVRKFLPEARTEVAKLSFGLEPAYPEVFRKMVAAVRALGEPDFTPMAAVAGSFSEMVKDTVVAAGADRVCVNNGGDISLYLADDGRPFRVGILRDLAEGKVTHVIPLGKDDNIRGIATSGFGGRSLTKGVASAVTVLSAHASYADAAATAVANATNCTSPAVVKCLAQELDSQTDINNHMVTKSIGILNREEIETALSSGMQCAERLIRENMIQGVVIFLQGQMRSWPQQIAKCIQQ
ncbi:MAG TPA: hypothetical protein VEG39_04570 [Clostridia bacterium]|nr:hypothetical protein [Clostridia bacterium]